MLIQRLLTAIILIPLVVIALFFLPLNYFVITMIMICGIAAWEWSQFLGYSKVQPKVLFAFCFMVLALLIYYFPVTESTKAMIFEAILILSIIWWLIALVLVIGYPKSTQYWARSLFLKLLFAFFTLMPFFVGMVLLRQVEYATNSYHGAFLLLYVLVLVWATDSGAYFAGKAFGRHKLAPKVSPGKTVEGLLGGVATSLAITLVVYFTGFLGIAFYELVVSSVLAIFVSVLGDLTESMFKREAKIKDSGNIIPGHGGMLDRIDSLTAAIPVFAALLFYLL